MINRIVLVGRLTADPEVRYTQSGIAVCRLRLAVDRRFRNANGEKQTDFIPVVAWRKLAELCGQYIKKGTLIGVDGSLQMNQWEQDGQKRTTYEVLADNIQFLDRGGSSGGGDSHPIDDYGAPPMDTVNGDEDLPF